MKIQSVTGLLLIGETYRSVVNLLYSKSTSLQQICVVGLIRQHGLSSISDAPITSVMPTLAVGSGASRTQDRHANTQSSRWRCALVSGTTQPCYRYIWSTLTPLLWHQPSRCTTLQTFYGQRPSFSSCRRQDLECTAGQSRLHNVITVLSVPSEDIFVPALFLVALQWT